MKKLPDVIEDTKAGFAVGQPGKVANLVKRTGDVAMYLRDDGYYEVGSIRTQKASRSVMPGGKEVFFEEKELYWRNEDFGERDAICTRSFDKACDHYEKLVLSKGS